MTQNSSPHFQEPAIEKFKKRHNESGTVHKLGEWVTLHHELQAIGSSNARSQCSYLGKHKNMQEHNRWHSDAVPRGAQHGKTLLKVWWNLRRRVELWLWKSRTSDRGRLVPSVHGVAWTTWAAGLDHGKAGAVVDNIQAWATDLAYASLRGNRIRWHLCTNSVSWRSQRRECFMFPWPPVGGLSLPNCSGKSFASYRVLSKSSGTKHASNHGCKCWENRASCGFSGVGTHWTSESSHWCTPPAFFSAALMRRFPFCSPGRIRGTHVLLPLYHGSRFERVERATKGCSWSGTALWSCLTRRWSRRRWPWCSNVRRRGMFFSLQFDGRSDVSDSWAPRPPSRSSINGLMHSKK